MQIILADNQSIFREGIARICDAESSMHVIAQCSDIERLQQCIALFQRSVVVFPSSITSDLPCLIDWIGREGSRAVMILEDGVAPDHSITDALDGVLLRSVAGPQLVDCLYRVAAGDLYRQRAVVKSIAPTDHAGAKAARRLTQKELQIVALVSEGCKNKEIASQLGTNEQLIKNYLRNIYGKTGVSDRLELALFTLHHRALAEVVDQARLGLMRTA